MSHKATYWLATVAPDTITAGAFRVLFHLCDYHNDERDPAQACFPAQETLRAKTGLSNGGLNKCLDALEDAGLIARNRGTVPGTSKRRTYYILGCDADLSTKLTPQSGDSPNSTTVETAGGLTPLLSEANSTFEGGKLHSSGEEPVKEPVKEQCVSGEADPHTLFEEFWEMHPRPMNLEASRSAFERAMAEGTAAQTIIAGAKAYAAEQDGNRSQFVAGSDSWLRKARWREHAPAKSYSPDEYRARAEKMINSPIPSVRDAGRKLLEANP